VRRYRHLDVLRTRCVLQVEVRRVSCRRCGVAAEHIPWARPGSRFTRAFEDTCVWLVRDAPKSVVSRLMRVDWETVGRMLERVLAEHHAGRDGLDGLGRIGVDEVSYRKGQHYLMCVVCHESGRIVWAQPGRSKAVLERFFHDLGPERAGRLQAVSVDMNSGWPAVIRAHAPQARICVDPFHVIKLAGEALHALRREEWRRLRHQDRLRSRAFHGVRFVLRRRAESLGPGERALIDELAELNHPVYLGWLLVEQLRATFQAPDAHEARALLGRWLESARASGLAPFRRVVKTLTKYAEGIVNAIALGVSNARLEAMNSTVRLMSHRSRGFRRVESLLAMIQLVCGKTPVALPT
jgi:transposase